jgi:hypothetical protein
MARKQRTPFTLKSGNATAFKNMGSYSPMMQADAPTTGATTTKTGLGKLLDDVKSLVQNVGGKLKEGRAAAISKEKDRKEVDSKRTGVERMNRKGKSQYQLDQMDAAEARKKKKSNEAPSGQETVSSRPDLQKGGKTRDVDSDGTPDFIQKPSNEDKNGGAKITPIQRKSPLEKGIGKYAKKAKGSRGYKMNK